MHKVAESLMHWTIAGIIAGAIAWLFLFMHVNENRPCRERPCFTQLDKRLAAIEAEMRARTVDRYTGADAKRDLALINQRIDTLHEKIHAEHP